MEAFEASSEDYIYNFKSKLRRARSIREAKRDAKRKA